MRSLIIRSTGAMVFLVAVSMVVFASDTNEEQPGKDKGKGKGKGKGEIVQVDLSKLHPGIAQYVRENALVGGDVKGKDKGKKKDEPDEPKKKGKGKGESKNESEPKKGKVKGESKFTPEPEPKKKGKGKGEAKSITLADAISIGERTGSVVKAERRGESADTTFRLEVLGRDGAKTRLTLDAFGRPVQDQQKGNEKGKGKGKGKGKDEE